MSWMNRKVFAAGTEIYIDRLTFFVAALGMGEFRVSDMITNNRRLLSYEVEQIG